MLKPIYPHQLLIKENSLNIATIAGDAAVAEREFSELYNQALSDEQAGKPVDDSTIKKLDRLSKFICNELYEWMDENNVTPAGEADEAAEAKAAADAEAATAAAEQERLVAETAAREDAAREAELAAANEAEAKRKRTVTYLGI